MIAEVKQITKKFKDITILKDMSFQINEQEMVAITGPSGSGKTTLLNILGLISSPDSGSVALFQQEFTNIHSKQAMLARRNTIGYLFQNYGLVDEETVEWNLNLALTYKKMNAKKRSAKIDAVLKEFHMESSKQKKIFQLSGGEQQRVAIMRLILQDSKLILADEPTGSLDVRNRDIVINALKALKALGKTIVIVTHDMAVAQQCDRIITI